MSANETTLIGKAERALESARLLRARGDTDGACDRAYYAMFDAARAALLRVGDDLPKTHSGTATLFGQHLVKPGLLPDHLGRDLNRVEELRNIADYTVDKVDIAHTDDAIAKADVFLKTVRTYLYPT